MKAHKLSIGVGLLCMTALLLTVCRAAEEAGKNASTPKATVVTSTGGGQTVQAKGTETSVGQETRVTVITGSYIPRRIRRAGRITDTALNVIVIDRAEIEHSGAVGVAELLAKEPGIKVKRN